MSRAASKLENFVSMINMLRTLKNTMTASEIIDEVIERTGIVKKYEEEDTIESQGRIENIKELLSVALEFENAVEFENEEKD